MNFCISSLYDEYYKESIDNIVLFCFLLSHKVQGVLHVMSTDLFLHTNMVQEPTLIMLRYFHLWMKSSDPCFGMEYVPKNPILN
ncbi:hypothetical protein P5673_007135 [Acropora cervicornis]|uniref:Uncharacterized protein n=1 Tax=Acropora cervicornis TaxID=6130 RepID=A0AAD9QW06_ACRCE|nr:hypothetical protein P5673_007135 [Acropora cervicornis]